MKRIFLLLISLASVTQSIQAQWTQVGIDLIGASAGEMFGTSISTSSDGTTIAIGAQYNSESVWRSGSVRVYVWNNNSWVQKGNEIYGESYMEYSGAAVCINENGSVLAIGSPANSDSLYRSGVTRIYEWSGTEWVQKGDNIYGESNSDNCGSSLSMSLDGNNIAIGSYTSSYGNYNQIGHVRVFGWNGSSWVQKGSNITGEASYDYTGYSISMSGDGNILAVGSYLGDGSLIDQGFVRVFEWNGSDWYIKGSKIEGENANDRSGAALALNSDGNTVVIGALSSDANNNAGHARIFEWNGTFWVQKGSDIDGVEIDDGAGGSVSINSEGNTVAIGSAGDDTGGENAGAINIYEWRDSIWSQKELAIIGKNPLEYIALGSMSADGSTVVAASPFSDVGALDAGLVRIYRITEQGTGMVNTEFSNDPFLFPNPTKDKFTIELKGNHNPKTISIANLTGRILFSKTFHGMELINLQLNEPAGIYLVKIESENKQAVIRLIKE